MKKLLLVVLLSFLSTLAYGQCLSPSVNGTVVTIGPGSAPDYFGCGNYANSPLPVRSCSAPAPAGTACFGDIECALYVDAAQPDLVSTCSGSITGGGIHKFVNTLPGLTPAAANDLGQYIPVGVPDTTTYPGSDYYEIAVVEYQEQMHSDLPATKLRGYVQLETGVITGSHYSLPGGIYFGVDKPHYLGPTIVAQRDRPVRILFRNLLPAGTGGNLFVPVDTTVMGSGMGPNMNGMSAADGGSVTDAARNPMCGMMGDKNPDCYSENRATLHLHGGVTPWISDGTAHQWITPAGDGTSYPKGVSVSNVPDMPDPGPGAMTFFYTNQQSARLMFYHDHAWGITRLNVYSGEAAGYVVTDATEQALMATGGPLDGLGLGMPLIIQDRTFVPTPEQLKVEDPTWDAARWGHLGSVWVPHVYMPAQNPDDPSGTNGFGRWMYGPWFWPPVTPKYPPIDNPYFDASCDPNTTWCQPRLIPGTPNQSVGMEHFNDTPVVNGTVYPTITLDPKEYRFRILNAANDRFWNLQWYIADPRVVIPNVGRTEVALKPAEVDAAQIDPNVFPTPDPTYSPAGPAWIQIGTEGGFLPDPVVVNNQPTTWITNPTRFDVGNVDLHSLLLAPAERADVIVDLTPFAGQTLILYNDAPAAFPARVGSYDYYTGAPDQTDAGGAPSTQPGYGPNTRTVMRVVVTGAPSTPVPNYVNSGRLAALQQAFQHHTVADANGVQQPAGVFETSQDPIVVGQAAYNKAYGTNFRSAAPNDGIARINNFSLTFNTLFAGTASTLTIPFQPKALHDEMNSADFDEYGRMTANIGLEVPNPGPATQNVVLYPFVNPATEIVKGIELPDGSLKVTPIETATDGTQIWRITHNGVDTHPIHFHLFNVQLLNRVTWDNIILKPEPSEIGWKETVRVSPLEDTIVAVRPIVPKIPFGVPDSYRPLNPAMPIGDTTGFNNTDANGNPLTGANQITNKIVNFGWEYVWHCHILGHEEMDMMRPMIAEVSRALPAAPVLAASQLGTGAVALTWTDGTPIDYLNPAFWGNPSGEIGYRIERAPVDNAGKVGTYEKIANPLANVTTFTDSNVNASTQPYSYRVIAYNAAGDSPSAEAIVGPMPTPVASVSPTTLAFGNQSLMVASTPQSVTLSNIATATLTIASITASGDFAADATACGTSLAGNSSCTIAVTFTPTALGVRSGTLTITDDSNGVAGSVQTVSLSGTGIVLPPAAPTGLTATAIGSFQINLSWAWAQGTGGPGSGFLVQRATGAGAFATIATINSIAVTTYSDTTVLDGTTYQYQVLAFNTSANAASNTATATTALAPPSGLAASMSPTSPGVVVLNWTNLSKTATGIIIQRAGNSTFSAGLKSWTLAGTPTTFTDTTAVANNTYYYQIRSANGAILSDWVPANGVPFTPTIPLAPSGLKITSVSQTSVTLAWTDNATNEGGFTVQRATNSNFTQGLQSFNVGPNATGFTVTGLTRNTRYYFRVRAYNGAGTSAWVNGINVVTLR